MAMSPQEMYDAVVRNLLSLWLGLMSRHLLQQVHEPLGVFVESHQLITDAVQVCTERPEVLDNPVIQFIHRTSPAVGGWTDLRDHH